MLAVEALSRLIVRRGALVPLIAVVGLVGCSLDFHVGARPAVDAGADATGPGSDAGATTDCRASTALFCADFQSGAVDAGWDVVRQELGGTVSLDTTTGAGSTRSARAALAAASSEAYAAFVKTLPGAGGPLTVELDVLVEPPAFASSGANVALANVALVGDAAAESPQNTLFVSLFLEAQRVTLSVQSPTLQQFPWDQPFPYGRWVHVAIDVDATVAEVRVDGDVVIRASYPSTLDPSGAGRATRVTLGLLGFNAPVPATSTHLDNVVVKSR